MDPIRELAVLKILGDSFRAALLRRLMARALTLTQLGEELGESPAHIRHHLKALEGAGLVELVSVRPVRGFLEKYYRATAAAFLVQLAILPEDPRGGRAPVISSNDLALQQLRGAGEEPPFTLLPQDSLDGLVRLREGVCDMATCHLLDPASGEYNRPFVRLLFPGQEMALVRLYSREEGLLLPPGNPRGIRGLEDLLRPDVRLINRERGSGTRIWLDAALAKLGIPREQVTGYAEEARSHLDVARAVQAGRADAGLGLPSGARSFGLEFVPLFEEPYDLACTREVYEDPRFTGFFASLNSSDFRARIRAWDGYSAASETGSAVLIH